MRTRCPACGGSLLVVPGAWRAFACAACGGVWIDPVTSQRVATVIDESLVEMGRDAAFAASGAAVRPELLRACPDCGVTLERITAGSTALDICKMHGTWFDRGELERVAKELARRRDPSVPPPKGPPPPTRKERQAERERASQAPDAGGSDAWDFVIEGVGELLGALLDGVTRIGD